MRHRGGGIVKEVSLVGQSGSCRILLGGRLEALPELARGRRTVIVTDPTVHLFQGHRFAGFDVVEIGLGEACKTLETVAALYAAFLERELDRACLVLGIGGGIVCDVAGFAASTYQRGLAFGFAPTTLLAQVDAAIGGKNGVNLEGYKNLVGVIRQPEFVLQDPSVLSTLPEEELRCGFAEVVKTAAVMDRGLFEYLEAHAEDVLRLDPEAIGSVVAGAAAAKVAVVQEDEAEQGRRMILNFGHTLGHALEKSQGVPHGYAVSVGMAAAAALSVRAGLLEPGEADRLEALLTRFGLPLTAGREAWEHVLEALGKDKKRRGDDVRLILLERLGSAVVRPVPLLKIERWFDDLRERR
jgi:3-dehydroquinate synthase